MRVGRDPLLLRFRPHRATRNMLPGDEELLLRRDAVNGRHRMPLHRLLKCLISHTHADEIGNGLAQHALAVMVDAGRDEISVELRAYALAALLIFLLVDFRPPFFWTSLDIGVRAQWI